jgi:hypothetical protein
VITYPKKTASDAQSRSFGNILRTLVRLGGENPSAGFNDLHADSGKGVQAVPLAITRDEERSRDRSRSESRPPSRASSVASSYRSDHRPATPTTNYFAGLESNVAGPTTRPFRTVTNIKTEAKQRGEVQVGWTIWAC